MSRPALLKTLAAVAGAASLTLTGASAAFAAPVAEEDATAQLKINEIETDGSPDWVELYNAGDEDLDATGITVYDRENDVTKAIPEGTTIPAGGVYVLEGDDDFKFKKNDKLTVTAADGETVLDSYEWGDFHLDTWGRVPNGTGDFAPQLASSKGELNPESAPEAPEDDSYTAIVINEVTSDADTFELYNTGDEDIDVADWLQTDDKHTPAPLEFIGDDTVVRAGGFLVIDSNQGLGSGGDAVKLYLADGVTLVDSVSWGQMDAEPGSLSRCTVDGGDSWLHTETSSFGKSNVAACGSRIIDRSDESNVPCQTEAPSDLMDPLPDGLEWPGAQEWHHADSQCQFNSAVSGQDVSGLDIDPNEPDVMWAVKNKSHVYRLVKDGDMWVKDTANNWDEGKDLVFFGETDPVASQPDTEGITVGPDGFLYMTTERNNADKHVALDSVLRFDPNEPGTVLHPTHQWTVTADFADIIDPANEDDANLGFEGITWIPDSFLVEQGFIDQNTGTAYDPAQYPGHGTGLYFLALEKNGDLYPYALATDGSYATRIADISSGMPRIADVQWDGDNNRIWAVADDSVGGSITLLKAEDGSFAVDRIFNRPAGLENLNLEGFALAPDTACVDGVKEVIRSDDGNNGGHSLWSGTVNCDLGLADADQPGDEVPGDQPGDEVPGDEPGDQAPGDQPGDQTPDNEPGDQAPAPEAPVDEAPAAPADENPAPEAPEAPAGEDPAPEAPAAPADEVPAPEAPAAPADETPAPTGNPAPGALMPDEAKDGDSLAPTGNAMGLELMLGASFLAAAGVALLIAARRRA